MKHVLVENHKMQSTPQREDRDSFKLPTCVKYAIQDAGRNPIRYKDDLELLKTPGSYLDPASRTQTSQSFGLTSRIVLSEFASFGMPYIAQLDSFVDEANTTCTIQIQFTYPKTVMAIFDINTYAPRMTRDHMYFLGNDTKNRWFNTANVREYSDSLLHDAYTYILVKELGDTLQAYYAKLFLDRLDTSLRNTLCVFTNDIPMSMRCRLFNVPVVVIDRETTQGSLYDSLYYPAPGIIDKDMQSVYANQCIVHNTCVIENIQKVITRGVCIIDTDFVEINDAVRSFLQSIIDVILHANTIVTSVRTLYMNMEQYRTFLTVLHAYYIFRIDRDGVYAVDDDIVSVFGISEYLEDYEEKYEFIDPIRAKGSNLRTILRSMLDMSGGAGIQTGSGRSSPSFQKYTTLSDEYIASEDYEYNFELRLQHMMYCYLLEQYPSFSMSVMHNIIMTISNHFYHYQTYTASVNLNTAFIHPFIEEYLTKKTLSHITLEAYAKRDKTFRRNMKKKPPIAIPVIPYSKHPIGLNRNIREVARAARIRTRRRARMYAFEDR
jgi:hypothetical protein